MTIIAIVCKKNTELLSPSGYAFDIEAHYASAAGNSGKYTMSVGSASFNETSMNFHPALVTSDITRYLEGSKGTFLSSLNLREEVGEWSVTSWPMLSDPARVIPETGIDVKGYKALLSMFGIDSTFVDNYLKEVEEEG